MASAEKSGTGEGRKGRVFNFLKKFNKISAAVLLGAGVVFDSALLIALGVIDAGQAYLWGKAEKWRQGKKQKAAKPAGRTAYAGATA